MKLIISTLACILVLTFTARSQSVCVIYKHDYGSAQDARIKSLKQDTRYNQHLNKTLSDHKYDRHSLESRALLRKAILAKQSEYQRLANQPFRDKYHPNFEIKYNGN